MARLAHSLSTGHVEALGPVEQRHVGARLDDAGAAPSMLPG